MKSLFKDASFESILRFLSVLAVLCFLYLFFKNICSDLFMGPESKWQILVGIILFAALVLLIVFGSSLVLKYGDKEIKINQPPLMDIAHVNVGAGGLNEMIDPEDNVQLKSFKITELARDGILTETDPEGRLKGYITIESFLEGCFNGECRPFTIFDQPMAKAKIYLDSGDWVVLGESLLSVAAKMVSRNASALPVLDHRGRAVGSITYRQVLFLLIQEYQKEENR